MGKEQFSVVPQSITEIPYFHIASSRDFVKDTSQVDVSRPPLRIVKNPDSFPGKTRQTREVVGSQAFNLEYYPYSTGAEIRDDLVSYLGEYRLKVKKFDYELGYFQDEEGKWGIGDPHRGEHMAIKAKRVIDERLDNKEPVSREEAELAGISLLNDQLNFAQEGDTILWSSPPGPKEEGYGEYGFVYSGKVVSKEGRQLKLKMTAIRVENPTIKQFNTFNEQTGTKTEFKNAEDFIKTPRVVNTENLPNSVDEALHNSFSFDTNDVKEKKVFDSIMNKLNPLIDEMVNLIKFGSKSERVKALYTLENYALDLKKRYEIEQPDNMTFMDDVRKPTLRGLMPSYSHKPPTVAGSCKSTEDGSGVKSSNILGQDSQEVFDKMTGKNEEDYKFDKPGPCRECKGQGPCGPCKVCEPCDTKLKIEGKIEAIGKKAA